jgi:hypothetical protein
MKCQLNKNRFASALATAIVTLQLVACGGGGGSGGSGSGTSGGNVAPAANTGSSTSKDTVTPSGDSATAGSSSAPVSTGSFTIKWAAPVTRTNGKPLSLADINGFRIHYGASAGNYEYIVTVRDGTAQAATVKNVPVGTYQVVMTTYDSNGLESGYSEKVSISVL